MSQVLITSFEKEVQGAVRVCVQRLKHVANTREARAEVMYDFNQETKRIVASAEEYFGQDGLGEKKALLMDQVIRKVMEAYDEVEIHVSVLPAINAL